MMDKQGSKDMVTILMVPGFTGSSPGHWQSIWERAHPEYRRVRQRDWDKPEPGEWTDALDRAVQAVPGRVILVGHSLGCITIVRWATDRTAPGVDGALLVAPSDVEAETAPPEVRSFAPIPLERLPFETWLVTSTNDPLVSFARAKFFAARWGSRCITIGEAGHIHTAAGYGPWPEGHDMLMQLAHEPAARQ